MPATTTAYSSATNLTGSTSGSSARVNYRYINSVSDFIGLDEIDALLDEIQDFDEVEPLKVEEQEQQQSRACLMNYCDSRTSVHSWDSHTVYKGIGQDDERSRMDPSTTLIGSPVSIYCDCHHFKSYIGLLRLGLIVSSLLGLLCLLSAGTPSYGLFSLPFVARIRLMIFIIVFTVLLTGVLVFLDLTLLYRAFPFHYHRWAIAIYTMECAAFMGSSALIVTLVKIYQESVPWIEDWTRGVLILASTFGFLAGILSLALAITGFYELCRLHLPKQSSDQLTLTERREREAAGQRSAAAAGPPTEPPITSTVWPIDDSQQPCCSSSRHHQPGGAV